MSSSFEWTHYEEQKKYLKERGFDDLAIKRLKLEIVTKSRLEEMGFPKKYTNLVRVGILFAIHDVDGRIVDYSARVWYQKTYVDNPGPKLLHLADTSKESAGRPPSVHFSPLADWGKLEYGQRVFICESVLKAETLVRLGFHAVGVGGAWGWSKHKQLHWSLRDFNWKDLGIKPVLFMDSDVNPEHPTLSIVAPRLQACMDTECGVKLEQILLPPGPDDGKWGCDDYVAHHGDEALRTLLKGDTSPIESQLTQYWKLLNDKVVIVHEVGRIYQLKDGVGMGPGQFKDLSYAHWKCPGEEGKSIPVARTWIEWDGRNEVDTLKYEPGQELVVKDATPSYMNLWRGWGVQPLAGDPSFLLEWLNDFVQEEEHREWILNWLAYPLQYPGSKLNSALMLVGPSGVGKGFLAQLMTAIYGVDNVWKTMLSSLENDFNKGLATAQMVIIEEADQKGGSPKVYNRLKDMITDPMVRLEPKGVDAMMIPSRFNFMLQSNHIDVLPIESFDRRFGVFEIGNKKYANNTRYFDPKFSEIEKGAGAASVFGYLLSRDLTQFDAKGAPPDTEAKTTMREATHSPVQLWVQQHVVDREPLYLGGKELDWTAASARELAWLYLEGREPINDIKQGFVNSFSQMLAASGATKCKTEGGGTRIKYLPSGPATFWVLKGGEYSETTWQDELSSRSFGESSGVQTDSATKY